jgi:hypothetical protein
MPYGVELDDLARNARTFEQCIEETAPGSAATEKHFAFIPQNDVVITKVRAVLLVDGAGSGNTVTIDVVDDGTSILSQTADFATGDAVDTINDEAIVDPDKATIAKGSLVQISLASAGTISAGHLVGVQVSGYVKAPSDS